MTQPWWQNNSSSVEIVQITKCLGLSCEPSKQAPSPRRRSSISTSCEDWDDRTPPPVLTTFYRRTVESILSSCILVWCGNFLLSVMDVCTTHFICKAIRIVDDPTYPSHTVFSLPPPGKIFCSIWASTVRKGKQTLPGSFQDLWLLLAFMALFLCVLVGILLCLFSIDVTFYVNRLWDVLHFNVALLLYPLVFWEKQELLV